MPGLLLDLIVLAIMLVIVGLIAGILVWGIQKMYPQSPPIVVNAIYVLAVLLALYLIVAWFTGALPVPARVR